MKSTAKADGFSWVYAVTARILVGVWSLEISEVSKGKLARWKLVKEVETSEEGGADRHIEKSRSWSWLIG